MVGRTSLISSIIRSIISSLSLSLSDRCSANKPVPACPSLPVCPSARPYLSQDLISANPTSQTSVFNQPSISIDPSPQGPSAGGRPTLRSWDRSVLPVPLRPVRCRSLGSLLPSRPALLTLRQRRVHHYLLRHGSLPTPAPFLEVVA
ncbi:hypothetical protein P280DRAFT_473118 [Massarina eburnea CBS 473.64]|uniref:Uncharacterized protein n=1 Tax=Massarina eburnea CBS 473.64 TaxID=1395130 RepID=A0A6A6RM13_9PLEO|nr:hypothetical protein P280DRAFT_473118 [Massarina eburnea CBS 473.64]